MSAEEPQRRIKLVHSRTMRVGTVNLDTGEVLDGVQVTERPRIKHFTQDYMLMFLQSFENVAKDKELQGVTTSVLLYIVSKAQMKNWVQLQQKEIADALNLKVPNVSRALKKLEEKGIIESTAKLGKGKSYRISIDFGWRGTGKDYSNEKSLRLVKARFEHAETKAED